MLKNLVQRHREEVADNNKHNYDKLKAIQVKMAARDSEYVHALAEKEADFERRFSEQQALFERDFESMKRSLETRINELTENNRAQLSAHQQHLSELSKKHADELAKLIENNRQISDLYN